MSEQPAGNAPMRPVTVSARIPASPRDVFAYVSDSRNDPEWCPNVEWVELIEGDGVVVGTRFRFHQHLDRPRGERLQFDVDLEVVSIHDLTIRWTAVDRFQTRDIEMTVVPDGLHSRVTQVTTATFRHPPGIAARMLYPRLARRTLAGQFRLLARRFDTPGRPSVSES
jgi:uncharacterized protein YndB with AHSA1/START domain